MKKTIKIAVYILVTLALCTLVSLQLKRNKKSNAQVAELANIQGEFYPVKVNKIKASKLTTNISTTGFLESVTDLIVLSETQGIIKEIYKEKGDFVKAGEIIAKVDDELLQAQYNASKAAFEQVQKEVKRFTKLYEQNAVTSQKLEEIKLNMETAKAKYVSSKRQLEDTQIKAPVKGFIESDFIKVGQFISRSAQICNIIDAKNLKLKISISEYDYKYLKTGQTVLINSSIYPEIQFTGQISYIGKKAGYGNTFDTEIKVNDTQNLLKAGMFVAANIVNKQDVESIYVPRRSINGSLKNATVFVAVGDKAKSVLVTTGNVLNDQVQILEGINSGDQLVIEGNYNLYDGAKIRVIN